MCHSVCGEGGGKTSASLLPLCTDVNVYAHVLRCKSDCFSEHDAFLLFSGQNVSTLFILFWFFFFLLLKIIFTKIEKKNSKTNVLS